MTEKTQPTDAELDMLIDEVAGLDSSDEVFREFARAVLAKWGTPQPSPVGPPAPRVEPVAWLNPWRADQVTTDYDAYGRRGIPLYTTPQPTQPQAGAVPLTDGQIDAVAENMPGGLAGFLKGWGWRQFAREILTLRRMPDWEPQFDCMTPKQEELALQFCQEIAGPRGKRGSPPDPVRLLEMAEALYKAEREHHHGIKGGQHG